MISKQTFTVGIRKRYVEMRTYHVMIHFRKIVLFFSFCLRLLKLYLYIISPGCCPSPSFRAQRHILSALSYVISTCLDILSHY